VSKRQYLLTGAFLVLIVTLVVPTLDQLPGPIAVRVAIASLAAAGVFIVDIPGTIARGKAYRAGVRAEIAQIEAETAAYVAGMRAETMRIEAETDAYVAKSEAETAAIYRDTALIEIEVAAIDAWQGKV
jgi:hypothetical protein